MQIGHILYSGIMPWLVYDGTAGTMLAPVVFAMLVLLTALVLLATFVGTQARAYSAPAFLSDFALSKKCCCLEIYTSTRPQDGAIGEFGVRGAYSLYFRCAGFTGS